MATGNVATEGVVWTFARMAITTGVGFETLLPIAVDASVLAEASALDGPTWR